MDMTGKFRRLKPRDKFFSERNGKGHKAVAEHRQEVANDPERR